MLRRPEEVDKQYYGVIPRDYQDEIAIEFYNALEAGHRRIIVVSPTGSGKSIVQSMLISDAVSQGMQGMMVVDRRSLVTQFEKTLSKMFKIPFEYIMAGENFTGMSNAFSASIQSLSSWFFKEEAKFDKAILNNVKLVCVDEARTMCTQSRQKVVQHFVNDGGVSVGFDATPEHSNLHNCYDYMIQSKSTKWFIDEGYLSRVTHYAPGARDARLAEKLKEVGMVGGEYNQKSLSSTMTDNILIGDILKNYKTISNTEYGELKPFVVAAVDRKHARSIESVFLEDGIKVRYIDANTEGEDRIEMFAQIENGEIMGLISVQTLIYGVDIPALHICINARPTRKDSMYRQLGGRVLRIFKGNEFLPEKSHAVFIDHGLSIKEHGYLDDVVRYSLDPEENVVNETKEEREAKESLEEVDITCGECSHVYKNKAKCPMCGHENVIDMDCENVSYINTELLKSVREEMTAEQEAQENYRKQMSFLSAMKGDLIQDDKFKNNHERIAEFKKLIHSKYKLSLTTLDINNIVPTQPTNEVKKYRHSRRIAQAYGYRKGAKSKYK